MLEIKLALKNLAGAGLRTWLTVFVLSFSLVLVVFQWGIVEGWNQQARSDMKAWEVAGGEYWHNLYDPYDPLTISDSHDTLPPEFEKIYSEGNAVPVLVAQASIYPEGRMRNIIIRGIDPSQEVIKLPSGLMKNDTTGMCAIIGTRMAKTTRLGENDYVTVRWRDANGTFDAAEIRIAAVFKSNVPEIDNNQLWIPLVTLQKMMGLRNNATYIILKQGYELHPVVPGWIYKDHDVLFRDLDTIIKSKKTGGAIIYLILLSLALLAVFDTQVLSIFRREKEIGTYIALGMTRWQVVRLFTIEGAMNSVLSVIAGLVWGTPLLYVMAKKGMAMPKGIEGYGLTIAEKLFPVYGLGTIVLMAIIVMIATTIVSYIPSRKIAGMKPTEALRGKVQ